GEELRLRIRYLVPLLPHGLVLQPEVRGEVDDARAALEQRLRLAHRHAIGSSEKDQVAALEWLLRRIAEREVVSAAQGRKVIRDLHARFRARSDRGDLDLRVRR